VIWALLVLLGIPIWLIVGALIAIWQIRRAVKRQPGVFEVSVRTADAHKWPRQPSYARVVRDVLVLNRGVALLRAEVLPVDAVIEFDLDETPRKPADAVGRLVTFEDGTQREIAVAADHVGELDRAPTPTRH
jgi:uncharacterized protein YneF (UPF0154 family)